MKMGNFLNFPESPTIFAKIGGNLKQGGKCIMASGGNGRPCLYPSLQFYIWGVKHLTKLLNHTKATPDSLNTKTIGGFCTFLRCFSHVVLTYVTKRKIKSKQKDGLSSRRRSLRSTIAHLVTPRANSATHARLSIEPSGSMDSRT